MFFDDIELKERRFCQLKQLPPTPETGWMPPTTYPSLDGIVAVGFDCEVKEMDLDHGPGWSRGKAHIVGASLDLQYRDGSTYSEYRPIRHEVDAHLNCDEQQTLKFWKDVLALPCPKIGANLPYDVGNASDDNLVVKGDLLDVQYAEALLDDTAFVDLDRLGIKYAGRGKETNLVYEWCAQAYGGDPTSKQRENLWRCSPKLVGPYAIGDAQLPTTIIQKQWKLMEAAGLLDVFKLECELIPLIVAMRRQGVRVDVDKADQMRTRLLPQITALYEKLYQQSGVRCESTTGKDIIKVFDALCIQYPYTEKGNPSINKEWLNSLDHESADTILEIRQFETIVHTFLESYILGSNINGVIHGEFHQLRSDEGGTRTGRFSSSNPNLQNIPVRTEVGKEIRAIFLPFEGHACWLKGDFSQLQYRLLAHWAVGPGSNELREKYNNDPNVDYHNNTQALVKAIVGVDIPRKPIKNINFATMFGAGRKKIKRMIQLDSAGQISQLMADHFYNAVHQACPYLKATMEEMAFEAQHYGYVTSLLKRRLRFDLWEPINYDERDTALPYDIAIKKWGSQIHRAGTHKAISGKLQGGEADIIKTGFAIAYREGVLDYVGLPVLTVHDEGDWSVKEQTPAMGDAFNYLKHIMETSIPCKVPIKFEMKCGETWGAID